MRDARFASSFRAFFAFELRYQLRQPLFWMLALLFGLLAFGAMTSDSIRLGGAQGRALLNAPLILIRSLAILMLLGVFAVVAFVIGAAVRDHERDTHALLFAAPIDRTGYLLGRFAGAQTMILGVFAAAAAGLALGSFMPWLEPARLGPFRPDAYLYALGVMLMPTAIALGGLFFAFAALTRSVRYAYLALVGFFSLYFTGQTLLSDAERVELAALLDPFGMTTLFYSVRYWTIPERNTLLPPLDGLMLGNRLLWMGIGLAAVAFTVMRFRAQVGGVGRKRRRARRRQPLRPAFADRAPATAAGAAVGDRVTRSTARPRFGLGTTLRQLLRTVRADARAVLFGVPFAVMLAFALFNLIATFDVMDVLYGTSVHPTTGLMLEQIQNNYAFLLLIVVLLYAGELVWRARSAQLHEIVGAMPTSETVSLLAAFVGLAIAATIFLITGAAATIGHQLLSGGVPLELGLYARGLALQLAPILISCAFFVALQALSPNKLVGYGLSIGALLGQVALQQFGGLTHPIYLPGVAPAAPYSDLNGFGHFLEARGWFLGYWGLFALAGLTLATIAWPRGTELHRRARVAAARRQLTRPRALLLGGALVAFAATGAYAFYNTDVRNDFVSRDEGEAQRADYEQRYAPYRDLPQPRVVHLTAEIDLDPDARAIAIDGRYRLINPHDAAIEELHISLAPPLTLTLPDLPPHRVRAADTRPEHGYAVYELETPLAPGATFELPFQVRYAARGFLARPDALATRLVHNGTLLTGDSTLLPWFGFDPSRTLSDRNTRREHDLTPDVRMPSVEDPSARQVSMFQGIADLATWDLTIRTAADQIALAPGNRVHQAIEGDRAVFRYVMDRPARFILSLQSGRYTVARDTWRDLDGRAVAIEVYHHPSHGYSVAGMLAATKQSLAIFTDAFGPYPLDHLRIVEFPRYARFAMALPGIVPFSESIGFIAKRADPNDIDYVHYVTAHEVAHQWWGHAVAGAYQQGAAMLSESLAQYSAMLVMEATYGRESMGRFMRYELDRYLRGRAGEAIEEMPLARTEMQPYIYYQKGTLAMYRLRDLIGQEAVNAALRDFHDAHAWRGAPYPTSLDLVARLRAAAGPEHAATVDQLFETITLYDNRAVAAASTPRDDGRRHSVTWTVQLAKMRADGAGNEQSTALDDPIEFAVLGAPTVLPDGREVPNVLWRETRRVTDADLGADGRLTLTAVVDDAPVRAGLDPLTLLIDRNFNDNFVRVAQNASDAPDAAATSDDGAASSG
ncbi:MAG: M1 family aminopeptidase [Acidobacteriota bacterium]